MNGVFENEEQADFISGTIFNKVQELTKDVNWENKDEATAAVELIKNEGRNIVQDAVNEYSEQEKLQNNTGG